MWCIYRTQFQMYCWMKLWTNIKNILLQISGLLLTKALMTTPLKSRAHQTSFMMRDAFISVLEMNTTRSNIWKLCLVILSAQHSAFHRAAISCTGNHEGAVRCVNNKQKPRYSYPNLSVFTNWISAKGISTLHKNFFFFAIRVKHYHAHG